jgi:hypothetical protein
MNWVVRWGIEGALENRRVTKRINWPLAIEYLIVLFLFYFLVTSKEDKRWKECLGLKGQGIRGLKDVVRRKTLIFFITL